MKRITIAALGLVVGATTGCVDMGLEGNVALEEAQDRPPRDLVAAIYRPTETVSQRVIVEGRLYVPSGLPLTADQGDLRPVGSAAGGTVYARKWDSAPYDAVYMELPARATAPSVTALLNRGQWQELRPVTGRTGPVAESGAEYPEPGSAEAAPATQAGH